MNLKEEPLGFSTSFLLQNIKKLKGDPLETIQNFNKSQKAEKRKTLKAEKSLMGREGPFCFRMVLYFMLEALDAFKILSTYRESAH